MFFESWSRSCWIYRSDNKYSLMLRATDKCHADRISCTSFWWISPTTMYFAIGPSLFTSIPDAVRLSLQYLRCYMLSMIQLTSHYFADRHAFLPAQFCPLHYLIVPNVLYPCPLNNAVPWIFCFLFLFLVDTHNCSCSTVTVVSFPIRPSILYSLFNNHTWLLTPSRPTTGCKHPALSPAVLQACWTFFFSAPLGSTTPPQFSTRQVSTTEFTYSKLTVIPILQEFLKNIYYAGISLLPSLVADEVLSTTQWLLYRPVTSRMHDTTQTFYFGGVVLDLDNILPWQTCFICGVG